MENWHYASRIPLLGICSVTSEPQTHCQAFNSADKACHRNVDHFFFIDVEELESTTGFAGKAQQTAMFGERVNKFGRNTNTALQQDLLKDFSDMPKVSKMKLEDYTVVNVSPSVIPTYLPGVRVYRCVICHIMVHRY